MDNEHIFATEGVKEVKKIVERIRDTLLSIHPEWTKDDIKHNIMRIFQTAGFNAGIPRSADYWMTHEDMRRWGEEADILLEREKNL